MQKKVVDLRYGNQFKAIYFQEIKTLLNAKPNV
jgi:hypothetical protein